MGKIIRNCPCCLGGVCTCCCSKAIGREIVVSFTLADSDDGLGGSLSCCLDGATVTTTYDNASGMWLGQLEGVCADPIWVAVTCPDGGRTLTIGVHCGATRPPLFHGTRYTQGYSAFTTGIEVFKSSSPYKYGYSYAHQVTQWQASRQPVVPNLTLEYPPGEQAWTEEAFLKFDSGLERTTYVELISQNHVWEIGANVEGGLIVNPSLIEPGIIQPGQSLSHAFLFRECGVSDVEMEVIAPVSSIYSFNGLVLRKTNEGFIWIGQDGRAWKVTDLDNPNGVTIETLAGKSHVNSAGLWQENQVIGDGIVGAMTTVSVVGGLLNSSLRVVATGSRIQVFGFGKMFEFESDYNVGATKHGVSGPTGRGLADGFAIWNTPRAISSSEMCESETLLFRGSIYSEYGEIWPSQDISACGCSPASALGSYLNILVEATTTLVDKNCDLDCRESTCDDCRFSSCVAPTRVEVGIDVGNPFVISANLSPTDISAINQTMTLKKVTRYDQAFLPTWTDFPGGGWGLLSFADGRKLRAGVVNCTKCPFWDDPRRPGSPGDVTAFMNDHYGCGWVSDEFELVVDPTCQLITSVVDTDMSLPEIADTTKCMFRWEFYFMGLDGTQNYAMLFLNAIGEEGTNYATGVWRAFLSWDDCDGPWILDINPVYPLGDYRHLSEGGPFFVNHWMTLPNTMVVTPTIPENMTTLNMVCPQCCDGNGVVGRVINMTVEDEANGTNNSPVIPLTMSMWHGNCRVHNPFRGDRYFQWSSGSLPVADNPWLVTLGTVCVGGGWPTVSSWQIIVECRFHETTPYCLPSNGFNCRDAWRYDDCGHFDWTVQFLSDNGCVYYYSVGEEFMFDEYSRTAYTGPISMSNELEAGCNPFYITGLLNGLGPDSVVRNITVYE